MTLAAAEALASSARKRAASWRLADRLAALRIKGDLQIAGWRKLAASIVLN